VTFKLVRVRELAQMRLAVPKIFDSQTKKRTRAEHVLPNFHLLFTTRVDQTNNETNKQAEEKRKT